MIHRALALTIAALSAPASAEAAYFAAIDDVPLPPGFAEREGGWSFAGEAGRIVEAEAVGAASGLAVRVFYAETLPALGWSASPQSDGALVFVRGRESLSFFVRGEGGATRLSARLVTRPAAMAPD
jgi:hypothetical protein